MASTRIVIGGGGFGGVKCARTLRKWLAHDSYDLVIFNRENYMVFHPLLAEVSGTRNSRAPPSVLRILLTVFA